MHNKFLGKCDHHVVGIHGKCSWKILLASAKEAASCYLGQVSPGSSSPNNYPHPVYPISSAQIVLHFTRSGSSGTLKSSPQEKREISLSYMGTRSGSSGSLGQVTASVRFPSYSLILIKGGQKLLSVCLLCPPVDSNKGMEPTRVFTALRSFVCKNLKNRPAWRRPRLSTCTWACESILWWTRPASLFVLGFGGELCAPE